MNILKYSTIAILVAMLILFVLSSPLIMGEKIFSNIFVDSYSPRKVLIIERNPIRIVMYGEYNEMIEKGNDKNKTIVATGLVKIIKELRKMDSIPVYPLNSTTEISVHSKLVGDRNRGAQKSVVIQGMDGKTTEIQTGNEEQ